MKWIYKSPKGRLPVRNPDWRSIATFENNPFQCIFEELDQVYFQYSKLEVVTKGASKLLGDCKVGNIVKELKKLQESLESDTTSLET